MIGPLTAKIITHSLLVNPGAWGVVSSPFAVSGSDCISCCHPALSRGAAKLPAAVTSASHKGSHLGMVASSNPGLICHAHNSCKETLQHLITTTSFCHYLAAAGGGRAAHSGDHCQPQRRCGGSGPIAALYSPLQVLPHARRGRCGRLLHLCVHGACCTCCLPSTTGLGTSRSSCLLHLPSVSLLL